MFSIVNFAFTLGNMYFCQIGHREATDCDLLVNDIQVLTSTKKCFHCKGVMAYSLLMND